MHHQAPSSSTSSSNFRSIFNATLKGYEKKTKKDLLSHPLAAQLQACNRNRDVVHACSTMVQMRIHRKTTTRLAPPRNLYVFAFWFSTDTSIRTRHSPGCHAVVGPYLTSVGGTTGDSPEVAASLSQGDTSRDTVQYSRPTAIAVPTFLENLGDSYNGLCELFHGLHSTVLTRPDLVFVQPWRPRLPRLRRAGVLVLSGISVVLSGSGPAQVARCPSMSFSASSAFEHPLATYRQRTDRGSDYLCWLTTSFR